MSSFIWKISLYRFLDSFKLIGAIFTLFLQQKGLNVFQISVLIAIWSATQLVLEVPMGIVADKYSRRNVLIIATLLLAVGFSLWLKGGFIFYAFGMILWGVRNALTSGTFEGFVYDELKSTGSEKEYGKVNGKLEGVTNLGFMFSAVLGGLIAQYSFNWVIILTILTSIFAALILFTTKSVKAAKQINDSKYSTVLKNALTEIKSNHVIFYIILFISLTFGISGSADEYWPLIFNSLGISTIFVGTLMALEFGVFALAGYTFHYIDQKIKFKNWNLILIIISGVLFILFGIGKSLLFLPLVFIASYLLKLALVKFDTSLQHSISSGQRATVLSIKSLTFEIVYLVALLFFGFISNIFGVLSVLYIWGVAIIFFVIVLKNKLI